MPIEEASVERSQVLLTGKNEAQALELLLHN